MILDAHTNFPMVRARRSFRPALTAVLQPHTFNNNYVPPDSNLKKALKRFVKSIEDYCYSSTLHGLRYVGSTHLSTTERLFWLLSFCTAICFAATFITNLYQKFNRSPVIVSFNPKMVLIPEIPFPAVTICNVNTAMKYKAVEILQSNNETTKRLLAELCNSHGTSMNESMYNIDNDAEHAAKWSDTKQFVVNINQKCSDMVKICIWEGRRQNCSQIMNTVLTDEGYCCSFNRLPLNFSLKDDVDDVMKSYYPETLKDWNPEEGYSDSDPDNVYPYRAFGAGAHQGLSLVLDADLNQYFCSSTNSIGFKSLLSNPMETPKVADVGFLFAAGEETRITIEPLVRDATEALRSLDVEKRQCFFAQERWLKFYRIYTESNCRLECQANYTLEQCGCVPYYLPKNLNSSICGQAKKECNRDAKMLMERFSAERLKCRCLPACNEITYSQKAASVGKIKHDIYTIKRNYTIPNINFSYYADNMAIVHFYYDADKFTKQTKSVMYGFPEFLSNTGGLLGLFMGFSFLSVVEIIYFLVLRSTCNIYKMEKRRRQQEKQLQLQRLSILPFIRR